MKSTKLFVSPFSQKKQTPGSQLTKVLALLGALAPSASSGALTFFLLDTESPDRGEIFSAEEGASSSTVVTDVTPSPFTNIENYKGFGADKDYLYFFNTEGAGTSSGTIQRINYDGTGKTTYLDVGAAGITNYAEYRGFAADENHFYFLNTEAANSGAGRGDIIRMDHSGGNQITLGNIITSGMFGSAGAANLKGLASDGTDLYLLNVTGGSGFQGRVYRIDDLGAGTRTQIDDLAPGAFTNGEIANLQGFAIPEPSMFSFGLLALSAMTLRRRRAR